jgi:hypothetical protein
MLRKNQNYMARSQKKAMQLGRRTRRTKEMYPKNLKHTELTKL